MHVMHLDPARWGAALAALTLYAAMCLAIVRARRGAASAGNVAPTGNAGADWLVAYASQTGTAELLARQTAETLRTGGLNVRCASLETLDARALPGAARILFIVSTYGEGDAPDNAARFAAQLAGDDRRLDGLHYGLLALGDRSYAHFCGFGRALDAALRARGAQALFARIDVDRGAAAALEAWQHHLSHLAGTSDAPDWSAPPYAAWRIAARQLLNPDSAGAPVYQLSLLPVDGVLPHWTSGDLAQLSAPDAPDPPRDYSIASLPSEGVLTLLVRLHVRADGSHGAASGWLCLAAGEQAVLALRLRRHSRFHLGANAQRPLILIGNGTGLAGLRAHLKSRIDAGQRRNWLLFGERRAAHDFFFRDELLAWQRAGQIETLDLAFSRDGGATPYVQHALAAQAAQLRAWVAQGAAIYVCGSLHGMAAGVHAVLAAELGEEQLDALSDSGRYRRDVY